jgi:hypothetical protein
MNGYYVAGAGDVTGRPSAVPDGVLTLCQSLGFKETS